MSNAIAPQLQSIKDALPYGYRIEAGGSIEESAKANTALVAVFPVMAIAMLALYALWFRVRTNEPIAETPAEVVSAHFGHDEVPIRIAAE